ncbi:MAG: amidohydrolase family protein, partial [Verrucomicrobiota bacterium]|nr:amidohydrolase family protein [Verrucomicrobiota bacterium]
YKDVAERSRMHQLPITTHLAESAEEKQMFGSRSGPLFELMEDLGRSMDDCGGITPLALLLRMGVMDERWIVAHLNELPERDLAKLSDTPKFHIVHCPRSHRYFGHEPFRMEALRALGFNICVGTDSLASNDDLSLFSELRHLADAEPALSARELIEMVTVNAARALHLGTMLGQLIPGSVADLAALPISGQLEQVYEEVIAYEGSISWMMVNGQSQDVS